jgi:RNase P/RNase MRP subunit p30
MIDVVCFSVDRNDPFVKDLGFSDFIYFKNLNIVVGGNEATHLRAVKDKRTDILVGCELIKEKDPLHWRASGLNQVLVKWAKKNEVAIGFSLSSVLGVSGVTRGIILGRMMQNVRLCRKYKVRMVMCSFARDIFGLRNVSDMQSFGRVLGMTPGEVKHALLFSKKRDGVRVLSL